MHRFSSLIAVLCANAVFIGVAYAQKASDNPVDTLEGVLRVHPKFHYRYYIDGFGDGQACALFNADKRLQQVKPGSLIRVRGDLTSRISGRDPRDKTPAVVSTWIIYMDVDQVEVLRGPVGRSPMPSSTFPPDDPMIDTREAAAGLPRLIGRTAVRGDDLGVVFHYELGKPLTHETIQQHVPVENIPRTRGVQITLTGSLHVPEEMTVLVWHAGGSPTGGVHRLYVDGTEVGSIGDDRVKDIVYRLELDAGAHPVKWVLTGGDFGPCVLQFVDLRTKRPLRVTVSEAEEAAAKKPPVKNVVDNSSAKPLPLPAAILDAKAEPTPKTRATDEAATRRAAHWVISVGGSLAIEEEGKPRNDYVYKVEELPQTPYEITCIRLPKKSCADDGLKNLRGLTKLTILDMKFAGIDGSGLQHLVGLPALSYLNIDDTAVDDDGMAHVARLKGLKGLSAKLLRITDAGLKHLEGHPNLSQMYLHSTNITDGCVVHLKAIPKIKNLSLLNLPITDAAIVHLAEMEQMRYLDLRNTKITDDGLAQLKRLPNLAQLQVDGTAVTAESVAHFHAARKAAGLPKVRVTTNEAPAARFPTAGMTPDKDG